MKKGFTLIELLITIVILAIILIIAVPQVLKTIETSRIKTFKNDIKMITKDLGNFNNVTLNKEDLEQYFSELDNYETINIEIENNIINIDIIGTNKYKNLIATGTSENLTIEKVN